MAILHRIAFFLACALFLQDMQAQSNFEFSEESSSNSSSKEDTASYKKEVKLVKEKASYVMGEACRALRAINVDCVVGEVGRRFMARIILDIDYNFKHTKIRILYAVAYLSEKIVKCISKMTQYVAATIINSLPPCIKKALYAIINFFKSSLGVVTEILRTVYNFAKDVSSCTLSLGECIKNVFDNIFSSVMRIITSIIVNTQEVVGSVLRLNKPGCPDEPSAAPSPRRLVIRCSKCVFCVLHPTARMCNV